ncbi:HupE/UreJ family protein [Amaricoccus sp.]|uniref:HupE/UreJ family protein n=1 Tax=Amaricoccus sp. TaxID=1872485 RepID=UPI001B471948|nr:HupE/UreJ family protein [Amaricoccus sp.]MBP7001269.1 HupE/UreJ family protein [Amaricoccus sp.]
MRRLLPALLLSALLPAAAFAHAGAGAHGAPFVSGLLHPLLGADHLLAMVAVGLLAGLAGARAVWAWPASFVGAMILGGALGYRGVPLPLVEPAILASVVVLGVAVALALRPPLGVACAVIGLFGVAHGYAHGLEGPALGGMAYGAGFVGATAALHLAGVAVGLGAGARLPVVARALGAATAAAGLALAFG